MSASAVLVVLAGMLFGSVHGAYAQTEIPDRFQSSERFIARGILDGNLIETNFRNFGEYSRYDDPPFGVWPRGVGGRHIDGIGMMVAGEVRGERVKWGLASTDTTLHPVIFHYRDAGTRAPLGPIWGWLPLEGFLNRDRTDPITGAPARTPALSDDPESWPAFWPDRLGNPDDPGWRNDTVDGDPSTAAWNGFFGKGITSADLEAYYVMDDHSDMEYAVNPQTGEPNSPNEGVFYPAPSDSSMGGLGLQVATRTLQWANVLVEDVAFMLYRITNVGGTNHDKLYFAQVQDYGLGEEEGDEVGAYDPQADVAYGYDVDGIGQRPSGGTYDLGYTGFAFLESPARTEDGQDNDEDGITDESRFSGPGMLIEGQDAIQSYVESHYNIDNFIRFNGTPSTTTLEDVLALRPAYEAGRWWTGDENLDWVGYSDDNENGEWDADEGELLNNDYGIDGLGPNDLGYPGSDTGEGDGMPTRGEPEFDQTDVDESDQIGLTGFDLAARSFYEAGDNLRDDSWMWDQLHQTQFPLGTQPAEQEANGIEPFIFFSSGPVGLTPQDMDPTQATDFFSIAWIFGEDEEDFFSNRRTAQSVYTSDYRFAQPPITPTLTATPGDGQVVLTWDTLSVNSFDRFTQKFDFEGYKLYRGTDPLLSDARTITDVEGTASFYEPIAQFDLEDGVQGTVNALEGAARYDLGDDTGLQFSYIDEDVQNGFTYYYALVAYDQGAANPDDPNTPPIAPQENVFNITTDLTGQVQSVSQNAAVVTPRPPAAGYVEAGTEQELNHVTAGLGTGSMSVQVTAPDLIDEDATYRVTFFDSTTTAPFYNTTAYKVENVTTGETIRARSPFVEATSNLSSGFFLAFNNDDEIRLDNTRLGWAADNGSGGQKYNLDPTQLDGYSTNWTATVLEAGGDLAEVAPFDYQLQWVDPDDSLYTPPRELLGQYLREDIPIFAYNATRGTQADLFIDDVNENNTFDVDDALIIAEGSRRTRVFRYRITFQAPEGEEPTAPQPGATLQLSNERPFAEGDYFEFTLQGASSDDDLAREQLDQINVVPNPYVAASPFEQSAPQVEGRGEREIQFRHLPSECTIRIYNLRGELVRTIQHSTTIDDGLERWNLLTEGGQDVAYGIYVYHIEAPGIGEHVGKLALVK